MNQALEEGVGRTALDLEAAFRAMEGEVDLLLERAAVEGWAPERLASEVDALFGPERAEGGKDA